MERIAIILLALLLLGVEVTRGDIQVLISVKFILNNDAASSRPTGPIGTPSGFGGEVTHGNNVLAATGRGYSLAVVEYLDIQPSVPSGSSAAVTGDTTLGSATVNCTNTDGLQVYMMVQGAGIPANAVVLSITPNVSFTLNVDATATNTSTSITGSYPSDYWYRLPARDTRAAFEAAALANQAAWRWNPNAINIYVNNSSSGQCAFVAGGLSISLGSTIGTGTVLHEIGHFHDLRHTHAGDPSCVGFVPPPDLSLALSDGDGLPETAEDHPCYSRDQLSIGIFHVPYASLTTAQQAIVNSAWRNVMSYHLEEILLPVQMDIWTEHANAARGGFNTGYTWFVANNGSDNASGLTVATPFATLNRALAAVVQFPDVVLLRGGTYVTPANGRLEKACTLRVSGGPVTITAP